MFSKKFGRLMFRLCSLKPASVRKLIPRAWDGSGFSWTAVCRQRTRRLQRSSVLLQSGSRSASHSTMDPREVRKFQLLANKWWDEQGEFAALHSMNYLRVPFVRDNLLNVHRGRHPGKPLAGLRILDVGCGGGLLTEPLGRLGATVLGIDPTEESINIARLHSSHDPDLHDQVSYKARTLEQLSEEEADQQFTAQFDAVVASEVVEHLADLETFAVSCNHVLKPGGSVFITTINQTNLSYVLGIVVAEQLLCIVPKGTHDWKKFISPVDLERLLESNGFSVQSVQGMLYNPLFGTWSWTNSTSINYALHAVKRSNTTEDSSPFPENHAIATNS